MSFLTPSERFVAAAVACDAFLFRMPLAGNERLFAFRVAATRLADIRRAILYVHQRNSDVAKYKEEKEDEVVGLEILCVSLHNLSVIGTLLPKFFSAGPGDENPNRKALRFNLKSGDTEDEMEFTDWNVLEAKSSEKWFYISQRS